MASAAPRSTWLALLLLPSLLAPVARAEGPGKGEKGGVFPEVAEVTKEDEAKAMLEALVNSVTIGKEDKIVEAIRPMVTKRHKSFVSDLKKLVADRRDSVAAAAAEALGSQGDKTVAPVLSKALTLEEKGTAFPHAAVRAAAVEALGRLGVMGSFDAIMKMVEAAMKDPGAKDPGAPKILRAAVRYFGLTKEKRAVSALFHNVEDPKPENVSLGSNPPEDYWKGRHESWVAIRYEVVWALKEITGKEFETNRRWENWFNEEGKKQGMK